MRNRVAGKSECPGTFLIDAFDCLSLFINRVAAFLDLAFVAVATAAMAFAFFRGSGL
jgi:hypothetical protein